MQSAINFLIVILKLSVVLWLLLFIFYVVVVLINTAIRNKHGLLKDDKGTYRLVDGRKVYVRTILHRNLKVTITELE